MSDIDTPEDDRSRIEMARRQLHRLQLAALANCKLRSGSRDEAFVTNVKGCADGNISLTDRQEVHMLRLCWRYRSQMPKHLLPEFSPDDPLSPHFEGWRPTVAPAAPPSARLGKGTPNGR